MNPPEDRPVGQTNPPSSSQWWQRNWLWAVPVGCCGCGCLTIGFVMLLGTGGLVSLAIALFQASGAYQTYQMAAAQVEQDPAVIDALGTPVAAGWVSNMQSHEDNGAGHACLRFGVSGSQTSGTAYVEAQGKPGAWNVHQLRVSVNGQSEPLVLVAPPATAPAPLCPDFDTEEKQRFPDPSAPSVWLPNWEKISVASAR
jgi:Cytochrome oxidase complex assembly protein 1